MSNRGKRQGREAHNVLTSSLSPFEKALVAARELLLGPPNGELGKIGELESKTRRCEDSTGEAIRVAQSVDKLAAFRSGFDEFQENLCALASNYHKTCFTLALRNGSELDASLSIIAGKIGSTAEDDGPAEFASEWTAGCLSTFLRVAALRGKGEVREIDSNGRVREFIRHVCGDYSDVLIYRKNKNQFQEEKQMGQRRDHPGFRASATFQFRS